MTPTSQTSIHTSSRPIPTFPTPYIQFTIAVALPMTFEATLRGIKNIGTNKISEKTNSWPQDDFSTKKNMSKQHLDQKRSKEFSNHDRPKKITPSRYKLNAELSREETIKTQPAGSKHKRHLSERQKQINKKIQKTQKKFITRQRNANRWNKYQNGDLFAVSIQKRESTASIPAFQGLQRTNWTENRSEEMNKTRNHKIFILENYLEDEVRDIAELWEKKLHL